MGTTTATASTTTTIPTAGAAEATRNHYQIGQDAVEHSNIVELLKISPHVLADEGRKHHGRVVPVENCKLRRCLEVLNLRPIILISKEFCSLECLVMLFVIYSGTSSGSPIFHKFPERGRLSLSWEENCTYSRGESLAWSQS